MHHRGLGSPARRTPCACACARRRHRRAPTSYGRRGILLRDCLQRVEKYDFDSSGVCSEEELGDEEEDEAGARLASAYYARAAADVPWTDVLSAPMLHLCAPFCLLHVCLLQMAHGSSLDSGLAQSSVWTRFAVVHLVRVLARWVARLALWNIACAAE